LPAVILLLELGPPFIRAEPEFKEIPAARTDELTPANGWPALDGARIWQRSLGGPTSNRFSTLEQITPANVARLEVAWVYHSKDGAANLQSNPIVVDGVIFAPTAGHAIVALDGATGHERWRFKPEKRGNRLEDLPARRGLLYWPGDGSAAGTPRIIFGAGNWVYALEPQTGRPITGFGRDGRTELPTGAGVTGAVWKDTLVMPGFGRDVFGYDVRTGALRWRFHTVPQPGECRSTSRAASRSSRRVRPNRIFSGQVISATICFRTA
jgi:glucose dehydrogenase